MCPICLRSFPDEEIQAHASGCDAYAIESKDIYNRPSTSHRQKVAYKCEICDRYTSDDGNLFEVHVMDCKNKQIRSMNGNEN